MRNGFFLSSKIWKKEDWIYPLSLTSAFILGVCLRLYLLKDQILIDDEWHGLNFIKNRSLWEIITQINPQINSSPLLNIYRFICYHSIGLTEWNMRLPVLVAGCALLIIFPLLVRTLLPDRAGIIFSFLLALSPFLIFYSRFARPYIIITLLSFLALLAAFRWMTTNKRTHAILFVLASVTAVYAHPAAVAVSVAPYLALALAILIKRFDPRCLLAGQLAVPLETSIKVMLAHAGCLFVVTFNFISHESSLPLNTSAFNGISVINTLQLVCGTASAAVLVAFITLALFGCRHLCRINPLLALLLLTGLAANVLFILFINPFGIETSAVFVRYCIAIIPIILLCVAVGMDNLLDKLQEYGTPLFRRVLPLICICSGGIALFVKGPLPVIYRAPNNFTSHLAFQGSYQYGDWQKSQSNTCFPSHEISKQDVPAFYKWLADDSKSHTVIEYPFDFADHSDLLYYYQLIHRKRVLAGYCSDTNLTASYSSPSSFAPGMWERIKAGKVMLAYTRPEMFLSSTAIKNRTHFRNMIDVANDNEVLSSPADYIILHKSEVSICVTKNGMGNFLLYNESVKHFKEHFARIMGQPVYEDGDIVVFALNRR